MCKIFDFLPGSIRPAFWSLFLIMAACLNSPTSHACQTSPDPSLLPLPELNVASGIPDLQKVLGFGWGTEIPNHQQTESFFQALANAAPDRCRWVEYGRSYENRSLNYLLISSPSNLQRLEEIRQNNLLLADPRRLNETESSNLVEQSPAIVWLGYSVHGNEICPTEAAMVTAYHLLADRSEATAQMLEKLVVIFDPLQNPDGRERFVNVFRESRGRFVQSFPLANEHTERWPGGRSNHYWFDMNRDWFLQSQQETQAKVAAYLQWQPHFYIDAHEMGRNSTFFFPPPSDPKNPFLLPSQDQLVQRLGQHHAAWFDRFQFSYTTREMFDAFYPGYGSEWPSLQGGLGVLWEQASPRGMLIERDDETLLSYADGVTQLYISGLATLEFAANHRNDLLTTFVQNRQRNIRVGQEGPVSDFFLITQDRPHRAHKLAELLHRNGIEVRKLEQTLQIECGSSHDADSKTRTIPSGSYHVSVSQPVGGLIRALLDREVPMDQKFLDRQLERNKLRLNDEIYDVTAWSLPLAFDVICYHTSKIAGLESSLIDFTSPPEAGPAASDQTNWQMAKVAYLIPGTDGAIRALSGLLQSGYRVHVCDETFRLNGRLYERGTLIIRIAENDPSVHQYLQQQTNQIGVEVISTDSAFVDEGAHFGGPHVHWIKPPRILLVVNRPTASSSGHIWFLFDEVLQYPVTRVNGEDLGGVDLEKFNTIVLPDGNYSGGSGFGEAMAKKIADWVAKGGTLITVAGGTQWAANETNGLLKNRLVMRKIPDTVKDEEEKAKPEKVSPDAVPGAFFKAEVFTKHWLTFHYRPELHTFYSGQLILTPTKETEGRSIVTFGSAENLLSSGFSWPESQQLLAETPVVVYRSIGRGHIVSFTNDPNYRAMYPSLQRLFINAAMFGAGH
jgi:hypothetical protein